MRVMLFIAATFLGLFLLPVVPMLVSYRDRDTDTTDTPVSVSSVAPEVAGCSMFCADGPPSMPMPGPAAPACVAFCADGPVSLPLSSSGVK